MQMFKKAALAAIVLGGMSTSVFAIDYCDNGYRINSITPPISAVRNIKIDTNNDVPDSWRTALELAVTELNSKFNQIDSAIHYELVNDGTHDTFVFWEAFMDVGLEDYQHYVAYAEEPTSNSVGDQIIINASHFEDVYSTNEKKSAMIHELFHNLGILHTNSVDGNLYPKTDQSPICNNTTWGDSIMIPDGMSISKPNAVDYYILRKQFPK